jgi:hypothetical protein
MCDGRSLRLGKAIKDFQQTQGQKADGKTSVELVQQMRNVPQKKGLIHADIVQ